MSFIPGGYEDEDSDEDFVDFTKNCKVYDERGVEIEEKIKEINNDEDVSKLKKFSIPKTFVKSIHYDGGKIRTFNELRIAVLNENTEAIEEFCTKVPDWFKMTNDTKMNAFDYAIAHVKPCSLLSLLKFSEPDDNVCFTIGLLLTETTSENIKKNATNCLTILQDNGYGDKVSLFKKNFSMEPHSLPENTLIKLTPLLSFLLETNLFMLRDFVEHMDFKKFLLMDQRMFIELGITQPGVLYRIEEAILHFHLTPWKTQKVILSEPPHSSNGQHLLKVFHTMLRDVEMIECSIEFTRRKIADVEDPSDAQVWKNQMLQLTKCKKILVKEIKQFKKKFDKFYNSRQVLNRSEASASSLPYHLLLITVPFFLTIAYFQYKN